ncbi:hypothetical protein [uncultured Brevundimonas sp.]|uniref:hypothetical protein n=1 Tax=uncultured Brevundimonas sp. TaxID=213418 RepID=UPI0030EDDDB6|tara:strand:+ start:2194 stop:2778 length:585 start_codon:yes stop_codon:yes gene_type:complete
MTMPPNDDWSDLTRTWTDRPATPPRLDPNLFRAVRRRDRLARLNFAGEIAGGVVTVGVVLWATLVRDLPWTIALAAIAFVGVALAGTLWSRRGDPGVLTGTPEAVVLSAIAQARTGYRWAWAGVATSLAAFVFVTTLAGLSPTGSVTTRTMLMMAAFLLVCIGLYVAHARRCRRRMTAHAATLRALRDDPATEP